MVVSLNGLLDTISERRKHKRRRRIWISVIRVEKGICKRRVHVLWLDIARAPPGFYSNEADQREELSQNHTIGIDGAGLNGAHGDLVCVCECVCVCVFRHKGTSPAMFTRGPLW